jgi:hypothetical protein
MPNTFNTMPTALAVRKLPLRLGPYNTSRFHIDVELPKGYRATRLPSDFQVKDRCVTIERHATVSGQRVRIELGFIKRCAEISPEDYPAFRKLVLRATSQLQDELVFSGPSKKKPAGEVGLNP